MHGETIKQRNQLRAKKPHTKDIKVYDITVPLELTKSNNTKMKDFIKSLVSPKWFYS